MYKSFLYGLIACALSISILGPSIIHYIDEACVSIEVTDLTEEESKDKKEKLELDKEWIVEDFSSSDAAIALMRANPVPAFNHKLYSGVFEIPLPPPEPTA